MKAGMTKATGSAGLARHFPDGVLPAACPTRTLLDHVTSRWGILVLVSLADGTLRWSELRRRVLLPLMEWIAERADDIVESA